MSGFVGVDDTTRYWRRLTSHLVSARQPLVALAAVACVGVGVGWQFGPGYGLLAGGGLLFLDIRT